MSVHKCTREAVELAERLKRDGANDKDISAAVGVRPETFSTWKNHPRTDNQRQLAEALKKAEADYKNALLAVIMKAGRERDWKAAAWLLERKYPAEYARQTRPDEAPTASAVPTFTFDGKRDA